MGLLLSLAAPAAPRAQSKSDAFAGKIPPVSANLFRKAGRWELSLAGTRSFNDAFYTKWFGEAKLGYHLTESWSAAAFFATGANTKAGSALVCPSNGGCHPASESQMYQVPGHINWMGGVEGAWAPVYGKLNLFSSQVVHFDVSVLAGADWITYQKVLSDSEVEAGGTPGTTSTIGVHGGIGARLFLSQAVALRLQYTAYFYNASVPNTPEAGKLRVENFAELGISVFLPFNNRSVQ